MNKEIYEALNPKEKAFLELLQQLSERLKRLAELMERELQ